MATDGTAANRTVILGGSDVDITTSPPRAQGVVNSYESYVVPFNNQPNPVATFEAKNPARPLAQTPSLRRYAGPNIPVAPGTVTFTEYPRVHALGVFDPTTWSGSQPRLILSGYFTPGIRWAHDTETNPSYSADVGQMPTTPFDPWVEYPTCLPRMQFARFWHNVVILPTGDLFAVGGVRDAAHVIFNFTPELFDGSKWLPMANHLSTHGYHSCAVLLPDGRVLVSGGEGRTWDYEIWEPPYFHLPSGSPRPTGISVVDAIAGIPISDILPHAVAWSQQCRATWTNQLPDSVTVDRVVMMKPAAMTHHNDGGQRCIRLMTWHDEDAETTGSSVVFQLPAATQHVPPGWWMIFLITSEGVPANAFWVNIG